MANVATPKWLTAEYMENTLKSSYRKDIKVLSIEVRPGAADGDNYVGQIFRIIVTTSEENKTFIAKHTAKSNFGGSKNKRDVFKVEADFFTKGLPHIVQYHPMADFAPKCYNVDCENRLILFEDLSAKRFELLKTKFLRKEDCVLVVEALACMHGSFHLAAEADPGLKNLPQSPYRGERAVLFEKFYRNSKICLDKSAHKFHLSPQLHDKLFGFLDRFEKEWFKVSDFDENKLNFIVHGDLWLKNFMFHYNENGHTDSVKILDYQLLNYNSFANDLQYFLFTSAHIDVILNDIDFLLEKYFIKLINTAPDIQELSLDRVKKEFAERYYFGFLLTLGYRSEQIDWEKILNDEYADVGLGNDFNVDEFHKFMPFFEKVGAL